MDKKVRAHVFIEGYVQGVCFRSYAQEEAERLNVKGWVKNLRDGRVEAVFEGFKVQVDKMINWCNSGPSHAEVANVEVIWEQYGEEFQSFKATY